MATAVRIVMSELGKCRSGRALERAVEVVDVEAGSGAGRSSRLFGSEEGVAAEDDGVGLDPWLS